jgi:serine/threonine protein kinase
MVTPAGVIKVLDFGLAAVNTPGDANPVNSATLTMGSTQAGMIMGTAGYMSPEQASGQPVDKRADIWAFGVVLWEMLTGKQLFQGTTVSHILASGAERRAGFHAGSAQSPAIVAALFGERSEETAARHR